MCCNYSLHYPHLRSLVYCAGAVIVRLLFVVWLQLPFLYFFGILSAIASVAEWSIALGCKPSDFMSTGVRIPPGAPKKTNPEGWFSAPEEANCLASARDSKDFSLSARGGSKSTWRCNRRIPPGAPKKTNPEGWFSAPEEANCLASARDSKDFSLSARGGSKSTWRCNRRIPPGAPKKTNPRADMAFEHCRRHMVLWQYYSITWKRPKMPIR